MIKFICQKIFSLFATLLVLLTLTFFLMKLIPGDPFTDEKALPHEVHQALRIHYGLEDPLNQQYLNYLKSAFRLDFGPSFQGRPVSQIIQETFPISALLGLEAIFLALSVGISLGVFAALQQHKWQAHAILLLASLGISIPSFILAVLLQYVLSIQLNLFPLARWGTFQQSILPSIALAAMPIAYITRLVHNNLSEVLKSDYIKTAHSKGLPPFKIIMNHALKNSLSPLLPYFGQLAANILVGSFVVEKIFGIPGLGQWFVISVFNRDYPMIMGTTLFYSFVLLFLLFIADIVQSFLDPRIRTSI